jgi:hypothetical protein
VIGKVLVKPLMIAENIYNMDETGVLLSVLNSLMVLIGKNEPRNYRGAGVKRSLITAIECVCVSADELLQYPPKYLDCSCDSWMAFWPFRNRIYRYCYQLYWIQHVFESTDQSSRSHLQPPPANDSLRPKN